MKVRKDLGNRSGMDIVVARCRDLGYHCVALKINRSIYINVSRPRAFLIGCSDKCGGRRGAEWVLQAVEQALAHRKLGAVTSLHDVFDVTAAWRDAKVDDAI